MLRNKALQLALRPGIVLSRSWSKKPAAELRGSQCLLSHEYRRANKAFTSTATARQQAVSPPLVLLKDAILPHASLSSSAPSFSITIANDANEQWAIMMPPTSTGEGSALLRALVSVLSNQSSARRRAKQGSAHDNLELHPSPHVFAGTHRGLVGLASFSRATSQSSSSSEFQDFSKRYGALRDEDLITLFERLMDMQGFDVGRVAAMRILPDKLEDASVQAAVRQQAHSTKERIERIAPLLGLHKPSPGSPGGKPLLYSPVISLSNGQLRRARIVSALIELEEAVARAAEKTRGQEDVLTSLLILDQPYSGLDEPSRAELASLLASMHQQGKPRIIQVLRRQDELPDSISHIVDIDTRGNVWQGPSRDWGGEKHDQSMSVDGIRSNRGEGIGVGSGKELARLQEVTVRYGDKVVLDSIDLSLRQGSRLIVRGANGSGKTTLLSLLSGTHPQSFSLPAQQYTLFDSPRAAPSNASRLLAKKVGYFGPDLLAAFPRRGVESGGLTVGGAIASGFDGVFSRVNVSDVQVARVRSLIAAFADCIAFHDGAQGSKLTNDLDETVSGIIKRPFIELTSGSQAIVLFLRAVANDPPILILDEPFQGMDIGQIARVQSYIDGASSAESLHARPDCAIVLVSHYVNEWPATMGEFLHLQDGKVIERI